MIVVKANAYWLSNTVDLYIYILYNYDDVDAQGFVFFCFDWKQCCKSCEKACSSKQYIYASLGQLMINLNLIDHNCFIHFLLAVLP